MTIRIVGLGPGPADLATVRAARQLSGAAIVLAEPRHHAAVRELSPSATVEAPPASPLDEARLLAAKSAEGSAVCRAFAGDPLVASAAARLVEALVGLRAAFTVTPGLVADTAVASELLAPFFRPEDPTPSYAVAEITHAHIGTFEWEKLATATDTIVLHVVDGDVAEIARTLAFHGRSESTPAVCELGDGEIVGGTLGSLSRTFAARRPADARLVVGAGVRAGSSGGRGGLHGRRILVTRAEGQGGALADLLRDEGATPVLFPLIGLGPTDDPAALEAAARRLGDGAYRAVLFTSQNAVVAFFSALRGAGLDARAFGKTRVGVVGPATARALQERGIVADFVAKEHVGEGLAAEALAALGVPAPGDRVLLPRAKVAREVLPDTLRGAGFDVDVVTAYVTTRADERDAAALGAAIARGEVAAVTLTSSSAAASLAEALGPGAAEILANTVVASIGDPTTATAERLGINVGITASVSTMEGLVAALAALGPGRAARP